MTYTEEQRSTMASQAKGKTVESLYWDDEGDYWVMTFTDDTEISFRFMAELQR